MKNSLVHPGGEGGGFVLQVIENDVGAAALVRGVGNELLELAAPDSVKMVAVNENSVMMAAVNENSLVHPSRQAHHPKLAHISGGCIMIHRSSMSGQHLFLCWV